MAGLCFCFFALVLFFPLPSDQIGGGFLVCYFFSSLSLLLFVFFLCSDGMEREACVCDHGFERSDLCAEIIIIIIIIIWHLNGSPDGNNIGSTVYCREEPHRYTVHLH